MRYVEVLHDPALGGQLVEARRRPLHAPGHRDVVGDRQEQGTGLGVGVPGLSTASTSSVGRAGWAGSMHQQW